jgi:hypothetical protein
MMPHLDQSVPEDQNNDNYEEMEEDESDGKKLSARQANSTRLVTKVTK